MKCARTADQRLAGRLNLPRSTHASAQQCCGEFPICRRSVRRSGRFTLRARARSADRTVSPARVSQKREYSRQSPETFAEMASKFSDLGAERPAPNCKSPPTAGLSAGLRTISSIAGMPGWGGSADRTGLRRNSLLTGNFTGKFEIWACRETLSKLETSALQALLGEFPD
jgi:hypothetical protein